MYEVLLMGGPYEGKELSLEQPRAWLFFAPLPEPYYSEDMNSALNSNLAGVARTMPEKLTYVRDQILYAGAVVDKVIYRFQEPIIIEERNQ